MTRDPESRERSLQELGAARQRAEEELRAQLDVLRGQVRAMSEAGRVRHPPDPTLPAGPAPGPKPAADGPPGGVDAHATKDRSPEARPAAATWLFGETLEELDRRERVLERAVAELREEADRVRRNVELQGSAAMRRRQQSSRQVAAALEADARVARMARELTESAAEAVAALADVQGALQALMEARNAESAARIELGVPAKARLMIDEAERQQLALVERLVGRRQELESRVRRARRAGGTED